MDDPSAASGPKWEGAFLAALARIGAVSAACEASGVGRSTVYELRTRDSRFAALWDQALEESADRMEAETTRRAVEGDAMPVLYNGRVVFVWRDKAGSIVPEGTSGASQYALMKRTRSDLLLIFQLKAARPEKYRDHFEGTNNKNDAGIDAEILHAWEGLTELKKDLMEKARKAGRVPRKMADANREPERQHATSQGERLR